MSIATKKLDQAYLKAVECRTIGGADIWRDLANLSLDCIKDHNPEQKAVAYGLYSVFSALWRDYDERPVTVDEVKELMRSAHEPFLKAIEFLEHPIEAKDAVNVLVAIIDFDVGVG